jgi:hypothetical protein
LLEGSIRRGFGHQGRHAEEDWKDYNALVHLLTSAYQILEELEHADW